MLALNYFYFGIITESFHCLHTRVHAKQYEQLLQLIVEVELLINGDVLYMKLIALARTSAGGEFSGGWGEHGGVRRFFSAERLARRLSQHFLFTHRGRCYVCIICAVSRYLTWHFYAHYKTANLDECQVHGMSAADKYIYMSNSFTIFTQLFNTCNWFLYNCGL